MSAHCSPDGPHKPGCRKDRPLCRWRRKQYAALKFGVAGPCRCSAYHFPHRPGAGECTSRVGGSGTPAGMLESEAEYRDRLEAQERSERIAARNRAEARPDRWLHLPAYTETQPSSRQVWVARPRTAKSRCPHCRKNHRHHDWCAGQKRRA